MVNIRITLGNESGLSIDRNYKLVDGQLPDEIQEKLQEMIDTLLDNSDL